MDDTEKDQKVLRLKEEANEHFKSEYTLSIIIKNLIIIGSEYLHSIFLIDKNHYVIGHDFFRARLQ